MRLLALFAAIALLAPPVEAKLLSGEIRPFAGTSVSPTEPIYGFLADSQLQTRLVGLNESWLRGAWQDKRITNVTLRPPTLDWASRAMLREYLQQLSDGGAQAVFYLGDGANNGCNDEFLGGYGDGTDPAQPGILRLLSDARSELRKPIFYVLGNHDYLAAGNASGKKARAKLCRDDTETAPNAPATKWEVIEAVDKFNRQSASGNYDFKARYASNLDSAPDMVRSRCYGPRKKASGQQRRRGCYLAATLDRIEPSGRTVQFQLLDTGDFSDVSWFGSGNYELEGMRGSMSFRKKKGVMPQTAWFRQHAGSGVDIRVALTHYPFSDLKRLFPGGSSPSSKLGRPIDLFLDQDALLQTTAYVMSAHTHTSLDEIGKMVINLDCGKFRCGSATATVAELNIGSTTDYTTGATLVRFSLLASGKNDMEFRELKLDESLCTAVYDRALQQDVVAAFGLDSRNRLNYRTFSADRRKRIYAALDVFAGTNRLNGWCMGLWASRLEGVQL